MSDPTFGMKITRVEEEVRPAVTSDMSIVGIIGTAPDADETAFPLDTPVFIYSDDSDALTNLGDTGTLKDAVDLLNNQLGTYNIAAKVVIVRVEEGADTDATITNIVGDSGDESGLYAFLNAGTLLGITPRLICAPGFTSQQEEDSGNPGTYLANPVCAALPAILGSLRAHAVVDGPGTTQAAALTWRESLASERLIPVDPAVTVYDDGSSVVQPMSPGVIGIGVRRDYEKNGLPFWSWANQQMYGIQGPSRPIRFSLTDGATEGQTLLANNIGILIRGEMGVDSALSDSGYVFIGTDNAGTDDLWQFYSVTRGRDYIELMMLNTLKFYLGKFNITAQTIQSIYNTMESALATLKAEGAIIDYKLTFPRDLNSAETLRLGKLTVSFSAEEAPVLRFLGVRSGRYAAALETLLDDLLSSVGIDN